MTKLILFSMLLIYIIAFFAPKGQFIKYFLIVMLPVYFIILLNMYLNLV